MYLHNGLQLRDLFLFELLRELIIMHPINLVLDTPAQPLPERPSTAGLGEVGGEAAPQATFWWSSAALSSEGRCCPARLGV